MSSKEAGLVLRESTNKKKKKKKRKDGTLDSMAASIILATFLERENYAN
jgi:RNase H-fold protein (predicted Holliday junction resolvase)